MNNIKLTSVKLIKGLYDEFVKGDASQEFYETEESISINGKKYKTIKESKERVSPTAVHPFKKKYQQIGGK